MLESFKEREILEIPLIIEEFKKHSLLELTKKKFDSLVYLESTEEYYRIKEKISNYSSKIFQRLHFDGFKSIDKIYEKIETKKGFLEENDLKEIKNSFDYSLNFSGLDKNFFKSFFYFEIDLKEIKTFRDYLYNLLDKEGKIKDDASLRLKEIRERINNVIASQDRILSKILKKYEKFLTEKNITIVDNRLVLQVDIHFKNKVEGVFHSFSNTKKSIFIEPEELVFLNNNLGELREEEKIEMDRILDEIKLKILSISSLTSIIGDFIPTVDFINSILLFMHQYDASYIYIDNDIELFNVYHPIIKRSKGKDAKPFNIKIQKGKSLMITGPNMGGKTAVLKTTGVCAILVKMGLPICANEFSKIRFYDNIFCDIGDEQSLVDGVSSFASHVFNYKRFVENSNENSLILLDEIGTGTSISEGTAFSISLINHFLEKNVTVIFTTHYDTIKDFALKNEKIICSSMKYDYEKNIPFYELEYDSIGQSGMFFLLKRYDFPEKIIKESYNLAGKDFVDYIDLVREYKIKLDELDKLKQKYDLLTRSLEKIKEINEREAKEYQEKKAEILKEYRKKLKEEIAVLRSEFELTLKRIKEEENYEKHIKEFKTLINEKEKNIPVFDRELFFDDTLKIKEKDLVKLKNGVEGIVEKVDGINVVIDVNGVKLKTSLSNVIYKLEGQKEKKKIYSFYEESNDIIDLRGKFLDDAMEELDRFILQAKSSLIKRIKIIHGHGKGILKENIRSYLKNLKFIKRFYPAEIQDGGDGVTIVEFEDY